MDYQEVSKNLQSEPHGNIWETGFGHLVSGKKEIANFVDLGEEVIETVHMLIYNGL